VTPTLLPINIYRLLGSTPSCIMFHDQFTQCNYSAVLATEVVYVQISHETSSYLKHICTFKCMSRPIVSSGTTQLIQPHLTELETQWRKTQTFCDHSTELIMQ